MLAHKYPKAKPEEILKLALGEMVERLEKTKASVKATPGQNKPGTHSRSQAMKPASADGQRSPGQTSKSRHVPAEVKRTVWLRDEARCTFVSANGKRCTGTRSLEFHHVVPFAKGGPPTVENIELRCRAHNAYEGELVFGDPLEKRGSPGRRTDTVRDRWGCYAVRVSGEFPPGPGAIP